MTRSIPLLPDHPPAGSIRIVLVGDTVGKPGMNVACRGTPWLKQRLKANLVIVNAENAADGAGLRQREYRRLIEAGVDAITLGDHIYKKREIIEVLNTESNIVRPANFPANAPGKRWCVVQTAEGIQVAVISVLGRVFMRPVDCPFAALQSVLEEIPSEVVLRMVDIHAEATSDKQSIGRYFDGRVTAFLGTHTHVPTADEQIFPGGSGFQCDVGMTGAFESILGREIAPVTTTNLTFEPTAFDVAKNDVRLSATWIDADSSSGKCVAIGRIQWTLDLIHTWEQEQAELHKRL